MYKLLIVDDEQGIAEGMKYLIERGCSDCLIADLAFDGRQGFEKAILLEPDLILTDIRMPELDGIDMIRKLKEKGSAARFIILSGYSDFEYAKSAISLGVDDYITKPVEEEELYEAIAKACHSLDQERVRVLRVKDLELQVDSFSKNMKEYVLKEMLHTSAEAPESFTDRLEEIGFPVHNKQFACAVFEAEGGNMGFPEMDRCSETVVRRKNEPECEWIWVSETDRRMVVIASWKNGDAYGRFVGKLPGIRSVLSGQGEIAVSAGAGLPHRNLDGIRRSYEEAQCALNYKMIKGQGSVILYSEIQRMEEKPARITAEELKELESCIDKMDDKGCAGLIEKIFARLSSECYITFEELKLLSLNLLLCGIRKMPFMQFQINEYLGKDLFSLESIAKFKTMEQLKNWIINMLKGMNELVLKQNLPEKKDVVGEVKTYISKNFTKEISLADISERFYINPSYFSQLFKKKTGQTYQNYVIELRISRAKKLFEETDLKIHEVGEMVGYTDTWHFSKLFERIVGCMPSEYKKRK